MKKILFSLSLIFFVFSLSAQITTQGTITKSGQRTVTVLGKPSASFNAQFLNINVCVSIPDKMTGNPTSVVISANYIPNLTWQSVNPVPEIVGGRRYYTFIGNDNNSGVSTSWTGGTDNPIVDIIFNGGTGMTVVQLNDLSPDGGFSSQSYWYVSVIGALNDITNYGTKFYGVGASNDAAGPSLVPTSENIVLPLELLNFTAKADQQTAILNWKTTNERDLSHFDIEKSANGKSWEKIGEVKATNTEGYQFTDETAFAHNNTVYYRLKMIDNDGQSRYSKIETLTAASSKNNLRVYPNPSRGLLTVEWQGETPQYIRVVDVIGKVIFEKTDVTKGALTQTVDLQDPASGVYTLQLGQTAGVLYQKIIISK